MKYQVSSKLLVLYGIICGIFVFAKSGHCATVYSRGSDVDVTPIENKSSTFSTKLSNTTDDDYKSNDSALAEQIIKQGGVVFGAAYSDDFRRSEYITSLLLELPDKVSSTLSENNSL